MCVMEAGPLRIMSKDERRTRRNDARERRLTLNDGRLLWRLAARHTGRATDGTCRTNDAESTSHSKRSVALKSPKKTPLIPSAL